MNRYGAGSVYFSARVALFLACAFGLAISSALAETPGVTETSVLIGSCSAPDGPISFLGRQTMMGASAYLHIVNDEGGAFGRKIQLQAFDDSYDPDKAPACLERMTKEGVFALGFFVGTPTAKVYVPLAQEDKIPGEQIGKLWEQNIRKIRVIYQDDPFGKTVLDSVKLALQKHDATPVARARSRLAAWKSKQA